MNSVTICLEVYDESGGEYDIRIDYKGEYKVKIDLQPGVDIYPILRDILYKQGVDHNLNVLITSIIPN